MKKQTKRAAAIPQKKFIAIIEDLAKQQVHKHTQISIPVTIKMSAEYWLMVAKIAGTKKQSIDDVVCEALDYDQICNMA